MAFSLLVYLFLFSISTAFASCPAKASLPSSTGPVSFAEAPAVFSGATHSQDPVVVDQIRHTLSLYSLAIDGKDYEALDLVFTKDAAANYSAPLGVVTPLSAIESVVQKALAFVDTQHKLSTQEIVITRNGCQAKSLTYLQADHFGQGNYAGQV